MTEQPDKLTIETPELIPLDFPLAGIGSRFLAVALDSLIQLVTALALVVVGMLVVLPLGSSGRKTMWVAAAGVIAYFLLQFAYFAGFEAVWNGQTPGKRHLHLRVIRESGRPISVYDALTRNLLRMIDSLPGFYGVGILTALFSAKNQRLGDFAAGTVVVHEQPLASQAQTDWLAGGSSPPSGYDLAQLTPEEFDLIEAILMRREQLTPEVRAQMARRVAHRLRSKLHISAEDGTDTEALVERIANDYRSRTQFH